MQKQNIQKLDDLPFNRTVALIKQNDAATLKDLYITNFAKVKRYVLKNSGDEQQAKDVYQYKWLDQVRSVKYKNTTFINRDIEFEEPEIDIEVSNNKKVKIIMDCIGNLSERCQTLLRLFYFERKPYKEIAQILEMDEASARNAKYRCQEQLKKMTQTIPNGLK